MDARPTLMYQPDDITCGPACVAMVADFLRRRAGLGGLRLTIQEVGHLAGTNPRTGTTHVEMKTALDGFGLTHARRVGDPMAVERIAALLRGGEHLVLLRTRTHGIPHWALAHGYDGGMFEVADPWLGDLRLPWAEVADRIRPRDWEYWEIPRDQVPLDLELRPLIADHTNPSADERALAADVLDRVEATFGPACGGDTSWIKPYTAQATDWEVSRGLFADGALAGFYLLNPISIEASLAKEGVEPGADLSRFDGLDGVEGVALVVDDALKGRGYGRLLRAVPAGLGFDYVFGMQLKSLGNLQNWLKHRDLVADTGSCWVTAAMLPPPELAPEPEPEGAAPAAR